MPWFKIDDTLHSHPKGRKAGLEAMGLWSLAGSHCMAYKSRGFVPDWFVTSWPKGRRLAAELVNSGLWDPADEGDEKGWRFHDWAHYQPLPEEIEADRAFARERQRRRRAKMREARAEGSDKP